MYSVLHSAFEVHCLPACTQLIFGSRGDQEFLVSSVMSIYKWAYSVLENGRTLISTRFRCPITFLTIYILSASGCLWKNQKWSSWESLSERLLRMDMNENEVTNKTSTRNHIQLDFEYVFCDEINHLHLRAYMPRITLRSCHEYSYTWRRN